MSERRATTKQKQQVAERAKHCCEYCKSQLKFSPQSFCIDHIHPFILDGETELDNLALACAGCNNHKYNKTKAIDPLTNENAQLFHPRQQVWNKHFCWGEGYTEIIGITPNGRASVLALQLNRPALQNLRKVLFEARQHPPD